MVFHLLLFSCCLLVQVPFSLAADPCDAKCTLNSGTMTSATIGSFPTSCARVCTWKIAIEANSGLTEQQLTNAFKNMKTLVGGLTVDSTTFTSLKFLAGLEKIESDMEYISISNNSKMVELGMTSLKNISGFDFAVYDNKILTKLNLPALKSIQYSVTLPPSPEFPTGVRYDTYIYIQENHPTNFCLTGDELKTFLFSNKNNIVQAHGKVCTPAKFTPKVCKIPAATCEEIYGDLTIGAKLAVNKLKNLKILYGSLIMKNTNFTNFNFFKNLTHIVQLDAKKLVIDVQGNKKFTSMAFPKLQLVVCDTYDTVTHKTRNVAVFKNNHNSLLKDVKSCFALADAMQEYEGGNPKVNGMLCPELEAKLATTKKGTTKKATTKKASG